MLLLTTLLLQASPLLLESPLSWPSSCCFYSCCCFLFCCCFVSSKLLQSLLLLLVAGFAIVACIPAVDGHFCCCLRLFTIVPDVLIVADLPAIVALLEVVGVPAVAFVPACLWLVFLHSVQYNVHCTMEHIKGYWTIGLWLSNYYFFLLSYYRIIEYRTGKFYSINYRTIGYWIKA
jgi:hypothetical protein